MLTLVCWRQLLPDWSSGCSEADVMGNLIDALHFLSPDSFSGLPKLHIHRLPQGQQHAKTWDWKQCAHVNSFSVRGVRVLNHSLSAFWALMLLRACPKIGRDIEWEAKFSLYRPPKTLLTSNYYMITGLSTDYACN